MTHRGRSYEGGYKEIRVSIICECECDREMGNTNEERGREGGRKEGHGLCIYTFMTGNFRSSAIVSPLTAPPTIWSLYKHPCFSQRGKMCHRGVLVLERNKRGAQT